MFTAFKPRLFFHSKARVQRLSYSKSNLGQMDSPGSTPTVGAFKAFRAFHSSSVQILQTARGRRGWIKRVTKQNKTRWEKHTALEYRKHTLMGEESGWGGCINTQVGARAQRCVKCEYKNTLTYTHNIQTSLFSVFHCLVTALTQDSYSIFVVRQSALSHSKKKRNHFRCGEGLRGLETGPVILVMTSWQNYTLESK